MGTQLAAFGQVDAMQAKPLAPDLDGVAVDHRGDTDNQLRKRYRQLAQ
jgi:hypothetical protein